MRSEDGMRANTKDKCAPEAPPGPSYIWRMILCRRGAYWLALLLVGYVFHLVGLANPGFLSSDDLNLLLRGKYLYEGLGDTSFTNFREFMYRPLHYFITYRVARWTDGNPFAIHLFLVTAHLLTCFLAYFLMWRCTHCRVLSATAYLAASAFPTAINVVHNFAAFADQLAAFFILASLAIVVVRLQADAPTPRLYGTTSLLIAITTIGALLSKEIGVVIPGLILILLAFQRSDRALDLLFISASLVVVYLYIRWPGLVSVKDPGDNYHAALSGERIVKNLVRFYLFPFIPKRIFLPNLFHFLGTWFFVGSAILVVLFVVALISENWRLALAYAAASLVLVAPVASLGTVAEHQFYVHGVLLAGLCAYLLYRGRSSTRVVVCLALIAGFLGALDRQLFIRSVGVLYERSNSSLYALAASHYMSYPPAEKKQADIARLFSDGTRSLPLPVISEAIVIDASGTGETKYWITEILEGRRFVLNDYVLAQPIRVLHHEEVLATPGTMGLKLLNNGYLIAPRVHQR
jgi:hypothetical protein